MNLPVVETLVYVIGIQSPRHQGISPPTIWPPRNELATNELATKLSQLATKIEQTSKIRALFKFTELVLCWSY